MSVGGVGMTSPAGREPILIGCSHGTADQQGRATIEGILADVRVLRPHLDVREAFVDVQTPEVAQVVARALAERSAPSEGHEAAGAVTDVVVVPLLLSPGFHTHVDIASAVDLERAEASATLGPDPRLADILVDRLRAVDAHVADTVVLAAAGSSDPRALAAVEQMRTLVGQRWPGQVVIGYGAVAHPTVPEVVAQARAAGAGRVIVASYLLAPGFFHDRLGEAGADIVTAPLGPDPRLARIVLERYDSALSVGESQA